MPSSQSTRTYSCDPIVEPDRSDRRALVDAAHAVVEHHHHDAVGVAGILRPRPASRWRRERLALRAGEVGHEVEMMHRAFDHQRVLHGVAEQRAPGHVLAHVGRVAAADGVDLAELARPDDLAQRRLVLVEAVAHRHRHLAPGRP